MIDKPRQRIYHGVHGSSEDSRVLVVRGGGDPTARRQATETLYELTTEDSSFWWGYGGGSPGRTARAIIEDVLPDLIDDDPAFADVPSSFLSELIVAFLTDFVAHFHDDKEFWLSAQAVIRWVHGYVREARTAALPS